jgi:hypothetical protein
VIQQALDFRALIDPFTDRDWERKTQFKEWTTNDALAHLHFGNSLADLSLRDSTAFTDFLRHWMAEGKQGGSHIAATHA